MEVEVSCAHTWNIARHLAGWSHVSPPCRDSFFASSPLPRMTWYQKIGRKRAMALATGRKPASKSINMSSRFEYGDLCFHMIIT